MHARRIVEARGAGPFLSIDDWTRRTGLSRAVAQRLAKAGAFESLELDRRGALWHALAQSREEMPLFDHLPALQEPRPLSLPQMTPPEEVLADYRTAGLSLRAHPLSFLRQELQRGGVTPAAALKVLRNGGPVCVAGIVLVRQRPGTAKGITFVTLEDETGQVNLIVRPDVWTKFRSAALGATLLLAQGRLQRQDGVIHVLVGKLEDLSDRLRGLSAAARNFQ